MKQEHADIVEKVRIFEAKNEKLLVMTNNATRQVQEKIDLIDQLRAEIDEAKATAEALRVRMDLLASKKEAVKEELASVKDQLWVAKNKADKWSRQNDELRAQLNSVIVAPYFVLVKTRFNLWFLFC
ncbi:ATP synthase subunit b, chloroplastic-like [Nicotiana tomentosiformis]|uniref:ATP synthase subunit b, chloroplastic-like n=1 Tax=Nicotiana tomentosiformis TaxID=4098 RepID=UPI00388C5130